LSKVAPTNLPISNRSGERSASARAHWSSISFFASVSKTTRIDSPGGGISGTVRFCGSLVAIADRRGGPVAS
jgi:hypothetical protein